MSSRVHEAVKAIALCHNVTPVYESNGVTDQAEAEKQYEDSCRVYQASSPDEVSAGQAPRAAHRPCPSSTCSRRRSPREPPVGTDRSRGDAGLLGKCVCKYTQERIFLRRDSHGLEICPDLGTSKRSRLSLGWPARRGTRFHLNHIPLKKKITVLLR